MASSLHFVANLLQDLNIPELIWGSRVSTRVAATGYFHSKDWFHVCSSHDSPLIHKNKGIGTVRGTVRKGLEPLGKGVEP